MRTAPWDRIEDPSDLAKAEEILKDLERLLADERAAVVKLESGAVTELVEKKRNLQGRLRSFFESLAKGGRGGRKVAREELGALQQLATRIFAQAEANAVLLADAIDGISVKLGLVQEAGTYDARARMRSGGPQRVGQHA